MADLVSMQPNRNLDLFSVAPDERREKVFYEINRPAFARLKPPLPKLCRFIPYLELKKEVEKLTGLPRPAEIDHDKNAAVVEYRDGTLIDTVYCRK